MNTSPHVKPYRHLRLILLVFTLMFVSTGCVAPRFGISWPALSTVELGGKTQIVVAFESQVNMINPENGAPTRLINLDGEVRYDERGNPRIWILHGNENDNAQFYASPYLLDDETLLFPAYNERILEVDLLTARPNTVTGISIEKPTIVEMLVTPDRFYISTVENGLLAIDRTTYDVIWRFETEEGIWAKPLMVNNTLYFGSLDHNLYAINADTGEPVWREAVNLEGAVVATPLLVDDFLYVGSFSHKLFKVSLDGQIVGVYEGRNWIWSTPVYQDGMLYYADLSGYVHAVNANTMEDVWSVPAGERGIRPSPLLIDNTLIVAARDGRIYWLDTRDGTIVFDRTLEGNPEILSDLLYIPADESEGRMDALVVVGTSDPGRLIAAYTVDNGRAVWVYGR